MTKFSVTAAAEKFMRRVVRFSGLPSSAGFRLLVRSGGCSVYDAEFSAKVEARTGDETIELHGLRLFLPAESRVLLDGLKIDFVETPDRSGFAFIKEDQRSAVSASADVVRIDVSAIGRG
ncbi:HesB/IscA family protein [Paraburkholderia atlantica]|uniref:HesB/YadR/YfhF-family protein n=1 Tax=Paraburkholderia atlantica TaxID=2654982 RepID=D5WN37_PARAM|nr:iron-sulfur cluster biosynthesis family protein [Paraburkholderia atlantica]ADG20716.1 HesB/YadR/YfhF-family protein [Paraburkholderia atlantica]MBB5510884.1 Fe-S cluster assembly iron-binding protein IscA [Paraburkholderia atlantica]